jgi:choice-of-anchor C domain-containing protein
MLKKLVFGALALSTSCAFAAPFANGSFELGPTPGSFLSLSTGDTSIAGWTTTGGSIDYIGSYWTASAGSRSVDLNNTSPGGIQQTFTTVASHQYQVSFDYAGNMDLGPALKTFGVTVDSFSDNYSFDTTGHSKTNMGWTTATFTFVADDVSATLAFASTTSGACGPTLDNVQVQDLGPVPEPSSIAAVGLGLAALKRRRNRA